MQISINNLTKKYVPYKPLCFRTGGLCGFALNQISFSVSKGECVGVIGANGSGKSTLLKLICGVTAPTSGEIRTEGKISALLELGAGFNPEYTGISNIYLNGAINGLTKKQTKALIPQIIDFAEIGEYIKQPVKTYSSGMFLRLAFACAIAFSPDILIIDEALAVGDFLFRQKCFNKISEMNKSGTTILMVSHDIDAIRRFCPRTIWLDKGELMLDGDTRTVSAAYMQSVTGCADTALPTTSNGRFGSAIGSVKTVKIPPVMENGKKYMLEFEISVPKFAALSELSFSVAFKNSFGLDLAVISTADTDYKFKHYGSYIIKINFDCTLCAGEYSISAALENRKTLPITYYDYADGAAVFRVVSHKTFFGVFHSQTELDVYEKN